MRSEAKSKRTRCSSRPGVWLDTAAALTPRAASFLGEGVGLRHGRGVGHAGEPHRREVLLPDVGAGLAPLGAVERPAQRGLVEVADPRDVREVHRPLHPQRPEWAEDPALDRREAVEVVATGPNTCSTWPVVVAPV